MSGSTAQPRGTSSRTHSFPAARTSLAKRSLKAPFTSDRARRRMPFRTASSMKPVAEVVPTSTGRDARHRAASRGATPWSSASIALERWPIIGRCIAASTSGWTSVGPGRKNARTRAWSCGRARELLDEPLLHDLLRLHEAHPLLAPLLQQLLGDVLVDSLHGVRDDEQARVRPALQQPLDRRLVAYVVRHAVQHDVVGVDHVEHGHDVLVREHVEAVLVEQDVAPVGAHALAERLGIRPRGLDDERIAQRGPGNLLLPGRPPQAGRGKRALPFGMPRDFRVPHHVVVRARDHADAVAVGEVAEPPQIRDHVLGVRYVQLAVRLHEVVLGVDIPEDDPGHTTILERGEAPGISGGNGGVSTGRRRDAETLSGYEASTSTSVRLQP